MPWLTDTVVAAAVGALIAGLGHLLTSRTERERTVLTVLQAEVRDLWERVQAQDKQIASLQRDSAAERARSWVAIEYCRTLISHIESLHRLLPEDASPPCVPPVPSELEADL